MRGILGRATQIDQRASGQSRQGWDFPQAFRRAHPAGMDGSARVRPLLSAVHSRVHPRADDQHHQYTCRAGVCGRKPDRWIAPVASRSSTSCATSIWISSGSSTTLAATWPATSCCASSADSRVSRCARATGRPLPRRNTHAQARAWPRE